MPLGEGPNVKEGDLVEVEGEVVFRRFMELRVQRPERVSRILLELDDMADQVFSLTWTCC